MTMKNGDKILRRWLLYSVSTDSVFCFACKRFGKQVNSLTKGGFLNWKNLTGHLKGHEHSKTHHADMTSWQELQTRLKTKTAIDQMNWDLMTQLQYVYMRHFWRSWISSTWTSETVVDSLMKMGAT